MKKVLLKKGPAKKDHVKNDKLPEKHLKTTKYFDLIGFACIILLGYIIYSNSFKCSFQFDDFPAIVNNIFIRNLANLKDWWKLAPHRPIGFSTFVLNYHFSQYDVRYWHFVNLVIHLINACLVRWLTLMILSSPAIENHPVAKHKKILALLTALLFVSHPLATESVTYIYQRLTSLVALFYLLAIALYTNARLTNKNKTSKYLLFAGSFLSIVAAIFTKENAFTLSFAIVLIELFFLRTKKFSGNFKDYWIIMAIAAFLSVIIIILLKFSFSIFDAIPPNESHNYTVTALHYLFTQFSVIVKYIQLLFLPIHQNLDYGYSISNNFFEIKTLLSLLLLLSLIMLALFLFKRNRIISFGIFWFFLTLSIESSFIPISDVIFEHRTYLPSFGFFLIITTVIYGLLANRNIVLASVITVIIVIINSYLTYDRNKVWKNDLTLWSDVVSKTPDEARPLYNRGLAYSNMGQWENAIADYSAAITIHPKYPDAYINRGVAYGNLGKWDMAITEYTRVIGMNPKSKEAYCNRGIAYGNLGQWEQSIADNSMAIGIDPKQAKYYYARGLAYFNLGQFDKAIADFTKAIGIDPKYTDAYSLRGVSYGNVGQWDKSISDYTKAIGIDPNYSYAYSNMGVAYGNLGQWDKSIANYSKAIAIDPKYAIGYYNRGFAYAKLKQWDKAISDYSKVIEIDPNFSKAYTERDTAYKRLGEKR